MRTTALLLSFGIGLLTLAGCSAASDDVASSEAAQTGPTTRGIIVQQAERVVSQHINPDGSVSDVHIAFEMQIGTGILRADTTYTSAPLGCTQPFQTDGEYIGSSLKLTKDGQEAATLVPLNPNPGAEGGAGTEEQRIWVTGVVGRYLFVAVRNDYYGCGAMHPSWGASSFVWDTWTNSKVSLEAPPQALEKAKAMLAGRGFGDAEPTLAALTPHFDAKTGELSIEYRFEKSASHAEADGKGGDYSISAFVKSDDIGGALPAVLTPLRQPPTVIASFLRSHPGSAEANPMLGWSITDDQQTVLGPMCTSQTLGGSQVTRGTCVQDSDDNSWFRCDAEPTSSWAGVSGPSDPTCDHAVALCQSRTLGRKVPLGTCVQDSDDGRYYRCNGGSATDWDVPKLNSCETSISLCDSGTLGRKVAEGTCVQDSQGSHPWYRCGGRGPADWSDLPKGPNSTCRQSFPFAQ